MSKQIYDDGFFSEIAEISLESTRVIVPLIMKLISPKSVVDVGCGVGTWLRSFADHGVARVFGLDGEYVDRSKLMIDAANFHGVDLKRDLSITGSFDLALCLEVAEHLPARCGQEMVEQLTKAAPVVLFSAAVPGQPGTGHVNAQWPRYWRELFEAEDFVMLDPFRPVIWQDERVAWWYRQNLVLYVSSEAKRSTPSLRDLVEVKPGSELEWVRMETVGWAFSTRQLSRLLPRAIASSISARFGRAKTG